jgi:hypothetical protein
MKQKFTIVTLFLTLSSIVYGQRIEIRNDISDSHIKAQKTAKWSDHSSKAVNLNYINVKDRVTSASALHKSTEDTKQRLDSEISQVWDELSNQYIDNGKVEYSYDNIGNIIQYVWYDWNVTSGQWIAGEKNEFAYDNGGNMILYVYYYWEESNNQWIPSWKEEYTYDNGIISFFIAFNWDETTNDWEEEAKIEFTYDGNGNETMLINYAWEESTGTWLLAEKSEMTFDANNNQTISIYSINDGNEWKEINKTENTYDGNDNLILTVQYDRDDSNIEWMPSWKDEYSYDTSGNTNLIIDYTWDGMISQWFEDGKAEYSYDGNGNPIIEIYYNFDETSQQFIESRKYYYTYDLSFGLEKLIMPPFNWFLPDFSDQIVNMPTDYYKMYWDEETNNWIEDEKTIYNYSEQTLDIVEYDSDQIRVFPNPVSTYENIVNISFEDPGIFELYDSQGCRILKNEFEGNGQVSVSGLVKGIYYYYISTNENRYSGKLIKN